MPPRRASTQCRMSSATLRNIARSCAVARPEYPRRARRRFRGIRQPLRRHQKRTSEPVRQDDRSRWQRRGVDDRPTDRSPNGVIDRLRDHVKVGLVLGSQRRDVVENPLRRDTRRDAPSFPVPRQGSSRRACRRSDRQHLANLRPPGEQSQSHCNFPRPHRWLLWRRPHSKTAEASAGLGTYMKFLHGTDNIAKRMHVDECD